LEIDVIHDARFCGARPPLVCGNQAIYGGRQKSPFGFVQKAMCFLGAWTPEQRGSFS
jgi:hypothetical protein